MPQPHPASAAFSSSVYVRDEEGKHIMYDGVGITRGSKESVDPEQGAPSVDLTVEVALTARQILMGSIKCKMVETSTPAHGLLRL